MDKNGARILIVEDDETLASMMSLNLRAEGYAVDTAASAEEALRLPIAGYDLILLDVMMGRMSGFELARCLRADEATARIPIIFCTALGDDANMVEGLSLGGDDYIGKPFSLSVLLARVEAVLRRTTTYGLQAVSDDDNRVSYMGVTIDRGFRQCTVDGRPVALVKKELEILDLLISCPGRIFSREEILDRVWKGEVVVLERTVDVNITRLRRKIAPYDKYLVTRSGFGYGFSQE